MSDTERSLDGGSTSVLIGADGAGLAVQLMRARAGQLDAVTRDALRFIIDAMDADCAHLLDVCQDQRALVVAATGRADAVDEVTQMVSEAWHAARVLAGECWVLRDVASSPPGDASGCIVASVVRAHAILSVPTEGGGVFAIAVSSTRESAEWPLSRLSSVRDLVVLLEAAHVRQRQERTPSVGEQVHDPVEFITQAIESAGFGVAYSDTAGVLRYVNKAFLDIWGQSDVIDVVGRRASEFWVDEAACAQVMAEVLRHGGWRGELVARCVDGTARFLDVTAGVVRGPSSLPIGMIASFVDVTARRLVERAVHSVVAATSPVVGASFFASMTRQLADAIQADIVLLGELTDDTRSRVRAVAVVVDGEVAEPFEYDLAGTPCDGVVGKRACFHADGLQAAFPKDVLLQQMGVEAYVGVPLWDSAGEPMGIMVGLFRKPLSNPQFAVTILEMFAGRTAAEVERSRAERDLRDSRAFLQSTLDALTSNVVILDASGKILAVNASWRAFADANALSWPNYGVGENYLRVIEEAARQGDEDAARACEGLAGLFEGRKLTHAQVYPCHSRQQERWFLMRCSWFQADGGRRVVVAHENVTEQVSAELAIEKLKRHNELILQAAGEGIFGLDDQGRHTFINPSAAAMLGYEVEELLGRPSHALWHYSHADGAPYPESSCPVYEAFHQGVVRRGEDFFWRKDGTGFPVGFVSTPIVEGGRTVGAVIVFRDISAERKAAEERARQEEQMRQSQKMEVIGRLAGGIAHDFNNLLAAIVGYSDLALGALHPDSPVYEDVFEIKAAGQRAAVLTTRLLILARQQVTDKKVLDVNQLVADIGRMVRRIIGDNIELHLDLAPDVSRIHADGAQIEQTLLNLVVNARDAMPDGGQLTLSTRAVDRPPPGLTDAREPVEYVSLVVTDTGTGMSDAVRARCFEPFFTTKESGKGTGLGLSTCSSIVSEHGGLVEVDTASGRGTTVTVLLPRASGRQLELPSSPVDTVLPRGAGEAVLVVDDDATVRRVVGRILRGQGYDVLEAPNAEIADIVARDHSAPVEVLVTDVVMPRVGGVELAARLTLRYPDIRVLFMSGYPEDALRVRIDSQRVVVLRKPFQAAAVAHAVRNLLDR